ncbi:hypothetical protein [Streptomyces sp. NPDC021020]|uniref:hypothetical protein n=1 Tax=Streptomyces sp. NPDC021020 TaxID=3365109 RepID=UPI0037BDEA00
MGEARSADRHPADTGWPTATRADGGTQPVPGADDVTSPALAAAPEAPPAGRRRGLDLSVPQVAGSAVAAVVAAKLASNLGVYGTIAGAGVVSALGTCGGSVLSYVFRHTGRRVQEAAVQAGPVARRALTRADGVPRAAGAAPAKELDGTDPGPYPAAGQDVDRTVSGPDVTAVGGPDRTRTLPAPKDADADAGSHDGYGAATSYRAGRQRRWRRPVVAVALAFGLTMAGITGYEAIAGENLSGHGGTTIGNAFTGHGTGHSGGSGDGGGTTDSPSAPTSSAPADRHPGSGEPSVPRPTATAPGRGNGGGDSQATPDPTPSAPTTPPATPDPTPTTGTGDGDGGGAATTAPAAPQPGGG